MNEFINISSEYLITKLDFPHPLDPTTTALTVKCSSIFITYFLQYTTIIRDLKLVRGFLWIVIL